MNKWSKKALWMMEDNAIKEKLCYLFILMFSFPLFYQLAAKAITLQELQLPHIVLFTVPCLNGSPMKKMHIGLGPEKFTFKMHTTFRTDKSAR